MNFKKTALVLAMAGVVAAPMAAQASAGDGAYASIRIGLQMVETNGGFNANQGGVTDADGNATVGSEDTNIGGYASRFGFKGETDLGNGMTGFGQYQFSVDTDGSAATIGNRLAYAGIKGDFGAISVGREYATFYDHVVGVNDNPWAGSGYAMVEYRGRQSNGLTYAGSAGAVSYGITLQMDGQGVETSGDNEMMDAVELGLSFDAGFATIGVAMLNISGNELFPGAAQSPGVRFDKDVIGLAISGIAAGPVTLGIGYQSGEISAVGSSVSVDPTSILIDALLGNGYLHYETLDADTTNGVGDMTSLAIGYTKSLGPQTSMWFEYHTVDTDQLVGDSGDSTELRAILKYDI